MPDVYNKYNDCHWKRAQSWYVVQRFNAVLV